MRYCIVIKNKIKEEYSNLSEATQKLDKINSKLNDDKKNSKIKTNVKFKDNKPKLVIIPDIAVGLKVYSKNDSSNYNDIDNTIRFIGEIISESDNLWFTKKSEDQLILDPWLKDNFEDKYINGIFVVGESKEI